MGMFMSPNTAAIMNSLPPQHRGSGSGMRATLMNMANPLSMVIVFSLMVVGLNATMPAVMYSGLVRTVYLSSSPNNCRTRRRLATSSQLF